MSRPAWFERLLDRWRETSRPAPANLSVRQLEPRRVLDAAGPAILIDPNPTAEGDTVTVSVDASGIDSPQFDWSVTVDEVVIATSNSQLFEFTPADNGNYTVNLSITDAEGEQFHSTQDVAVMNVPPKLSPSIDVNSNEGSLLVIADLGKITDDGFRDTMVGTDETFTYTIDWGDGTPVDVGAASIDMAGSPDNPTLASFAGQHVYADNGVYTVTLSVMDDDGGTSDTATLNVNVSNVAPELTVVGDQMVNEGSPLSIVDLGQISDRGFINSANSTDETFTYSIDWGDGSPLDTGDATIDQLGGVGVRTDASFDGTHVYTSDGTYTVKVIVADDDGGMAMGTFDVEVINAAPSLTVVGDQTVDEGQLLSITDLGQITDPVFNPGDGDQLTYSIDWGDGSLQDMGIATIDQLGMPTLASFDGQHIYADNGTYTVTVTVDDGDGGTDMGTFDVEVENVLPTLTVVEDQTIDEGAVLAITDLGKIGDPGFLNSVLSTDETFSYTINWGDGTAEEMGTATIDQIGGENLPTLASFDGSHIYADNGTYEVTVTVMDDDGGLASDSFMVTVGNVDPVLTVVGDQTIDEGAELSITNIGQLSDPGFNNGELGTEETFGYSIDWGDGTPLDTGDATIDELGDRGVPTLASFDGSHIYADNGTYEVTVTVMDDDGGLASDSFMVTVGNVDPVLTVVGDQTIDEGAELSVENIGQISDPAFRSIPLDSTKEFTYTIDWGDGTISDMGTATIDQLGGEDMPTLASFDGSHIYADNGSYEVTITVMDDDGGAATDSFMVTVENVAPALTVVDNQTVDEGAELSITNIGQLSDPGFNNNELGTVETFTYTIDWGDGTFDTLGDATIDQLGDRGVPTLASFDASHTYGDNGLYTVTVTVVDDDGGDHTRQFTVLVSNVAPELTGVESPFVLDEGQIFTLAELGVGLSDPGFDSPFFPSSEAVPESGVGGGDGMPSSSTTETFTATQIDWGDGNITTPVDVVERESGSPGVLTTAGFEHAAHAYADNGTYTVTVDFADDDGAMVSQSFTIVVNNVAPDLTLTSELFTINEGDTLTLPLLGTFEDPGYDNPIRPEGASLETFTYSIDWGDGTPIETGVMPSVRTSGSQGIFTTGELADSHLYADNDVDNTYTITVTLMDDDGGMDVESFEITVLNVAPTLDPISALDVNSSGETTLTLTFSDPGADSFEVLVAWGENQDVALEDRWVLETVHEGPTPTTYVLMHTYDGPPNPDNISADIPISVVIRDDDFATGAVTLALGQSNIETVLVGQPGIDDVKFAIDTTPDIPAVEFPALREAVIAIESNENVVLQIETQNVRSRGGDTSAASERFFRLHVVLPDGAMLPGIRLPDWAMDDVQLLFERLPDNHYRIFLVRGEGQAPRLVLDVVLRNHRPVDPGDASDGTRDKPPVNETSGDQEAAPPSTLIPPPDADIQSLNGTSETQPTESTQSLSEASSALPRRAAAVTALAAAAAVVDPKTDWAVRLDRAFARADRRRWQNLRRRRPR